MIISTNKFIPVKFKAYTLGFIILVRPEHRNSVGLIEHEKTHVEQFWRNPLMGLFYKFSVSARHQYELEAHKVQYRCEPELAVFLAHNLANNYDLDITVEQAYYAITGKLYQAK